jgi:cellulose synthase/poly-beta-1,6-N-acetylglucosamine synthase-like glycosyltransferase
MKGYDTSFPVACAEDAELSYRMSARAWIMRFVPTAVVFHTHPDTLWRYVKKKYKFAFWRVQALSKNPAKTLKDSHTPQVMKAQLLFPAALLMTIPLGLFVHATISLSALVISAFLVSTLPFSVRAARKDLIVGLLSPMILAARACSQAMGIALGVIYMYRAPSRTPADCVS